MRRVFVNVSAETSCQQIRHRLCEIIGRRDINGEAAITLRLNYPCRETAFMQLHFENCIMRKLSFVFAACIVVLVSSAGSDGA
jgi:hypothetical protein